MTGFLCAIPLLSALVTACQPPAPMATGYVEGDYVLIAPISAAELRDLPVARGDRVAAGQTVAVQETRDADIALAQADAALLRAQSDLSNLQEGLRPDEILVLEAALSSARASAREAETELARQERLRDSKVISQAQLDQMRTRVDIAHAKLAEAEAQLTVARLPARPQQIEAARAGVAQAEAARDAARWQLEQRRLTVPAPGVIYDVIRRPGELTGPAAPVLSYLPDGAVKLRLYVPEQQISAIAPGTALRVGCDGCPALEATVTYVADGPEFTPPVIYSLQNRQKLVYLIEAQPTDGSILKPGQIVEVDLAR